MRSTAIRFRLLLAFSFAAMLVFASTAAADTMVFRATLTGSQETPPNASTGIGDATVTLDTLLQTLMVDESFTGLIGGVATGAHIHCCVLPGVAASIAVPFPIPPFPAATSGTFSSTFDLTLPGTFTSSFLVANGGTAASASAALIAGLSGGLAYVNIHDAVFPSGEIRGQLQLVPESSTLMLLGTCLVGLAGMLRRRMRN